MRRWKELSTPTRQDLAAPIPTAETIQSVRIAGQLSSIINKYKHVQNILLTFYYSLFQSVPRYMYMSLGVGRGREMKRRKMIITDRKLNNEN